METGRLGRFWGAARTGGGSTPSAAPVLRLPSATALGISRRRVLAAVALVLVIALGAGAYLLSASSARLFPGSTALATVDLPLGGGTIQSLAATDVRGAAVTIRVSGDELWPAGRVRPGELISIWVVVRRPSWLGWLTGSTERVHIDLRTPSSTLTSTYLTLAARSQVRLSFAGAPVARLEYGAPGHLHTRVLAPPLRSIVFERRALAGTLAVAAVPRLWEHMPAPTLVSYFPAGRATSAIAYPASGRRLAPGSTISLVFSTTVARALGSARPRLSPFVSGRWSISGSHTIVFTPHGYGFGLGGTVRMVLPSNVHVVGGQRALTWAPPPGSPARAAQVLAQLGYLPVGWRASVPVGHTAAAQEAAAIDPPSGRFHWLYGGTPGPLRTLWERDRAVVVGAALMAFENDHGVLGVGGVAQPAPGPDVWHALIRAALLHQIKPGGYTYVHVSVARQQLLLWNRGHTVLTTPVNTGIPGAPTATGTYPVYEHIPSGTMSGTNPDGSHYSDPGIPWISYFNGGDALHGFNRASYGSPQSLGCVEMPPATAGRVWPYTPVGTLVSVQ